MMLVPPPFAPRRRPPFPGGPPGLALWRGERVLHRERGMARPMSWGGAWRSVVHPLDRLQIHFVLAQSIGRIALSQKNDNPKVSDGQIKF